MTGPETVRVALLRPEDIVRARQAGRDVASRLGFGMADQTRLATAISEIARNALHYGGGGSCEIAGTMEGARREIRVSIVDHGPGIPNLEQAMQPGFSTGHSLGMGLPGARKLVDLMTVETGPGLTRVDLVMRRGGRS